MEEQEISVRAYQESDIAACRRLWEELVIKHREIYNDPTIGGDDPARFFDDHLSRIGPDRIWVAVKNENVVGMIGLIVDGEDAEIEPIIVAEGQRGSGIGSQLLHKATEVARDIGGVKFLTVRPVARNDEALAFFRIRGLSNVGRVELFADLSGRRWEQKLVIHGLEYGY